MKRETMMTGEELRARIKALGFTYREAAEYLALTLDGLNKQMRSVRPVGRQTELLLGYVEEAVERASAAEAAPAPQRDGECDRDGRSGAVAPGAVALGKVPHPRVSGPGRRGARRAEIGCRQWPCDRTKRRPLT